MTYYHKNHLARRKTDHQTPKTWFMIIVVKRKLSAIISFYMLVFERLSILCKPIHHFTAILFTLLFATTFTVYVVKIGNAQK